MTPRTQTRPLDEKAMWRKLLGRCHPDGGGDHSLFIWCAAVRDAVCGGELQGEGEPQAGQPSPGLPRVRSTSRRA
jgi:hypothetical protein